MGAKLAVARLLAGSLAAHPARLCRQLRRPGDRRMRARRLVVASSLLGMASMVPVVLYQSGVLRHLPDPPWRGFHSDHVNASPTAYGYGGPDAPLTLLSHAVNLWLATVGGRHRVRVRPWLPVVAAALAGAQAAVAARYLFHQMPRVDRAWCPYCITDAVAHMASFAANLPEAWEALRRRFAR